MRHNGSEPQRRYRHRRSLSQVSTAESDRASTAITTTVPPIPQTAMLDPVTQVSSTMSIYSIVDPTTTHGFVSQSMDTFNDPSQLAVPAAPRGFPPDLVYGASTSDDSPFYSSDSCYSPNSEYSRAHIVSQSYHPMHQRQRSSSTTSLVDPYFQPQMMKSPLCSTSTLPAWSETETSLPPQELLGVNHFEGAFLQPVGTPHLGHPIDERWAHSFLDTSNLIPLSELDGYEWIALRRVLSTAAGLALDKHGMVEASVGKLEDYLDCYWQHFHPLFPIIHRPTFFVKTPPPLLAAAMVAIGAQFSTRPHSKSYSTFMHEACMRLLPTVGYFTVSAYFVIVLS